MSTPTRPTIILNRIALDQFATATGGASPFATGGEAANALTEDAAEIVRWTLRRGNVITLVPAGLGERWNGSDAVGVIGLNCSKNAYVRFSSNSHIDQWAVPTSTPASNNVTGTHADVDDGIATVDGNLVTPSVTNPGLTPAVTTCYIRVRFPSPIANLAAGMAYQHFALAVSLASSSGETGDGLIGVELYQNGVQKADLGWRRVNSVGPISLVFPWDASSLTSLAGTTVEAHVKFWWADTATALDRPRLESITWGQMTGSSVAAGAQILQSGMISVNSSFYQSSSPVWGPSYSRSEEVEGSGSGVEHRNIWYFRDRATSTSDEALFPAGLFMVVLDDGVPHWDGSSSLLSAVPKETQIEPLQFSAVVLGYAQELSCTHSEGEPYSVVDPSERKRTAGGQVFGVRRRAYRRLKLKFDDTTDPEAWEVYERLMYQRQTLRPFLIILHPGETTGALSKKHTSLYGVISDLTPVGAKNEWDDSTMLSPFELNIEEAI